MTETSPQSGHVPCDLCGSEENEPFLEISGRAPEDNGRLVKCSSCGLVFISPRRIYNVGEENYFDEHENVEIFRHYHNIISRWARPGGLFLDIGCGAGYLLDIARANGWETAGLEIWEKFVHFGRYYFKLDIRDGLLAEQDFAEGAVKVAAMTELIEHIATPSELLEDVHKVLDEKGVLFLTTPNIASKSFERLGEKWTPKIDPERHLYYFSVQTIDAMLEKTGFTVMEQFTEGGDERDEHVRIVAAKSECAEIVAREGKITKMGGRRGIEAARYKRLKKHWFFGPFVRLGDSLVNKPEERKQGVAKRSK